MTELKRKPRKTRKYTLGQLLSYFKEANLKILKTDDVDIFDGKVQTAQKLKCVCLACDKPVTTTLSHVIEGKSCNECGRKRAAKKIKLSERHYNLLASKYDGFVLRAGKSSTDLSLWKCQYGHEVEKSYTQIKSTERFCDTCSGGKHGAESKLREIASRLLKTTFVTKRFKEAKGLGGGALEIDIYNEKLKLGIEHHGFQHYEPVKHWDKSGGDGTQALIKLKEHDRRTREYCCSAGITLIEVRQLDEYTTPEQFRETLYQECKKANIPLPEDYWEINIKDIKYKGKGADTWERALKEAEEIGLKPLDIYRGWTTKIRWECKDGHRTNISPKKIHAGRGCSQCKQQPVILSSGDIFESITECALFLGKGVSDVWASHNRKNLVNGYAVKFISPQQYSSFKTNTSLKEEFIVKEFGKVGAVENVCFILSDGRLFRNAREVAFGLGAKYHKGQLKRDIVDKARNFKEFGVEGISFFTFENFRKNPKEVDVYCENRWGKLGKLGRTPTKPIVFSTGEVFPSLTAAANHFGVPLPTMASRRANKNNRIYECSFKEYWLLKNNKVKREEFIRKKNAL